MFQLVWLLIFSSFISNIFAPLVPINSYDGPAYFEKYRHDGTSNGSINCVYPCFVNVPAAVNAKIEKYISEIIHIFKKDALKVWQVNQKEKRKDRFSRLKIEYDMVHLNERFISIILHSYYDFAYTAHPGHNWECINYDLNNEKFLTLKDLFPGQKYWDKMSLLSREKIENMLIPQGALPGCMDENRQTTPSEKNFTIFTFDDETINLYFDWPWLHLGKLTLSRKELEANIP